MTTTNAEPVNELNATDLRRAMAALASGRTNLITIREAQRAGASALGGVKPGHPLYDVRFASDGTVSGPGVPTMTRAQVDARLAEINARIAEINALLPAAEQRDAEQAAETQKKLQQIAVDREKQDEATIRNLVPVVREAIGTWNVEVDQAHADIAAWLRPTKDAERAALAAGEQLGTISPAVLERVLGELGEDGALARRLLPRHHPLRSDQPVRPAEPLEFGAVLDALLAIVQPEAYAGHRRMRTD